MLNGIYLIMYFTLIDIINTLVSPFFICISIITTKINKQIHKQIKSFTKRTNYGKIISFVNRMIKRRKGI